MAPEPLRFATRLVEILFFNAVSLFKEVQSRAPQTCGDPTQAESFIQGWSSSFKSHVLEGRFAFVNADDEGADWQVQGTIFRAWKSAQTNTVPFFRLFDPTTSDFIFVTSPTGAAPVISGFQTQASIGQVYETQICDSVPLYVVAQAAVGDHWYTTELSERDELISVGWLDEGIAAYVLPLDGR
ncbi:hypothetical protein GALMADRAFT_133687 [Galerina marginata CBS 339.88]|uniref:DUF5648 domain-containing protein n=1 Tax=Galerina marginata (strain CBS 339.88) TaxID=685588 RepID=A0A067TPX3_GALM3|nr:hypothetical protein GALMADRAFT_133687 [Galerina marginata CBS 339.88]